MSEKCLIVEGAATGADSKNMKIRCRIGFKKLLENANPVLRAFQIEPKGSRRIAYKSFKTEHESGKWCFIGLWIDSEDPITNIDDPWTHIANRTSDPMPRPKGATDNQVVLMTTCMETLIAADPDSLAEHYGSKFASKSLPALNSLEAKDHKVVIAALEKATQNCKAPYKKDEESFALLEKLDPEKLKAALPSFARTIQVLEENLQACPPIRARRR